MNPLLPLFLEETQELIAAATRDLMALERDAAGGAELLDRVFRSFHTLKGGSALFGLGPMTALLHAAEDVLGEARDGRAPVGQALVDGLLRSLDDVQSWLPTIAHTEALPAGAEAQALHTAGVLKALHAEAPPPGPSAAPDGAATHEAGWPAALAATLSAAERAAVARQPRPAGAAVLAVAYDPDPRCFYRGDDPVGLFRNLPGLAVLRVETAAAPASLEDIIDPYECWLRLRAIVVGAPDEVSAVFRLAGGQVCIARVEVPAPDPPAGDGGAEAMLRALLEEQALLLDDARAGTRAAAARVAANACRAAGRDADASAVAGAADGESLRRAVAAALGGASSPAAPAAPRSAAAPARMLRVAPERVERMIELAGEAVIARNALQHIAGRMALDASGQKFAKPLKTQMAALDRLVRDWHAAAVRLRMVPAAEVFDRIPRLVRDLARQLGREVELRISGETLEADRDVLDSLFEPLAHLVRNSLDHGIESPEERRAAGKPATATLSLRARSTAETIVIELEDDGRGIDTAALRRRAVARGLLGAAAADALSETAAAELIFMPGLSTASQVSTISGRGVGMDAVRGAAEAAGGRVAIENRPGRGLRVGLHLPLQASVVRIITVFAAGRRFGVPLDAVVRLLRLPRTQIRPLPVTRTSAGGRAIAYGEGVIPVIGLAAALGLDATDHAAELLLLVIDAEPGTAALEVDDVGEHAEVILRPMSGLLAGTPGYLGTTLLGDGGVLLVLDVLALLR